MARSKAESIYSRSSSSGSSDGSDESPAGVTSAKKHMAVLPPILEQPKSRSSSFGQSTKPPGLEILQGLDTVVVEQEMSFLEVALDIDFSNEYRVYTTTGELLFIANEVWACCDLCKCKCASCGRNRGFDVEIFNADESEDLVMLLKKSCHCGVQCELCGCVITQCCCCQCCNQRMAVEAPPGTHIGVVQEVCGCFHYWYKLLDENGEPVLMIRGPWCLLEYCRNIDFQIRTLEGEIIGAITKNWEGLAKEYFTDADTFTVTFPIDLDVRVKAILLGAAILIDFMYFEKPVQRE